jgi:hypothetical protein
VEPEAFIRRACAELVAHHRAHTVLLYGSHAHDTANEYSDVDLAAFGDVATVFRDARQVDGLYLDAFVYPESALQLPAEEHLKLRGSKILVQRGSAATDFLVRLEGLYARGPEKLSPDEAAARKTWARKMVERASRSDPEGDYRRHWVLTALLEDYFRLRGKWFEGPKAALRWLEQFDEGTFEAFRHALAPDADLEAISRLVPRVVDEV